MNENGYCKNCNLDFDGEDILLVLLRQNKSPKEALDIAEKFYGYKDGKTKFSKVIAVYSVELDRTVLYICPDCGYTWDR